MEGLRAIQITVTEGSALAAALGTAVAQSHYAKAVPDHDLVTHILNNGGAILVVMDPPMGQRKKR